MWFSKRPIAVMFALLCLVGMVASSSAQVSTAPYRVIGYYLMGKDSIEGYPGLNCDPAGATECADVPLEIEGIPAKLLTHINLAFLGINENHQVDLIARYSKEDTGNEGLPVATIEEEAAIRVFERLNNVSIEKDCPPDGPCVYTTTTEVVDCSSIDCSTHPSPKVRNPELKTLYSIGGWNFSRTALWQDVIRDPAKRDIFANSAVDLMLRYGFDGIDIDWEYPNYPDDRNESPDDGEDFATLLALIRSKLTATGGDYLLTIASAGAPYALKGYIAHMGSIATNLDFVNIMNYDYSGPWDTGRRGTKRAQFHANLYHDSNRKPYWFNFLVGLGDDAFETKIENEWTITYLRDRVPHWRIPDDDNGSGYGGLYFGQFTDADIAANTTVVIPESGELRKIGDLAAKWDGIPGNGELKVGAKKYNLFAQGDVEATGYEQKFWLTNDYMFDLYRIAGVPSQKLVMGVPFYGRVFRLNGPGSSTAQFPIDENYPGLYYKTECDNGSRCTFHLDYDYMQELGCVSHTCKEDQRVISFRDVAPMKTKGWTAWNHEHTAVPGLYINSGKTLGGWAEELFVTYENEASVTQKATFVKQKAMGGIMFWELSHDDDANSLLNSIVTELSSAVIQHTITVSVDAGNGSISPSGSVSIIHGTNQTFQVIPDTDYEITDVQVDDLSQGIVSSYTFINVVEDHTIKASFEASDPGGGEPGGGGGSICDGIGLWQPNTMYKQGDQAVYLDYETGSLYEAWRLVKRRESSPDTNSNWVSIGFCQKDVAP